MTSSLSIVVFNALITSMLADTVPLFRRFEYKHSFRVPYLAQRDHSIPFWVVMGDAIATAEREAPLRLAPSIRSRRGLAWNKKPFMNENFEIEVALKVTGPGRIGADGMAIWYTKDMGQLGPVYGAADAWTGLAVILDSYDNDAKQNNPYVSVMINDGTRHYDHHNDGVNQILGGCHRDFRNQKFPFRVRVEYINNVLTVSITDGRSDDRHFEPCIRIENIFLPRNGFFGVSAATGGLADDHDVLEFDTTSLLTEAQRAAFVHQSIPQDERQRYDAEFAKQQHEYEEERKKFKEKHPEKAKEEEEDPAKYYEDATDRELRFIHENQAAIYRSVQQMEFRLSEIAQSHGIQTTILQQIQQQRSVASAVAQQPTASTNGFMTHEKTELLQSMQDLSTLIRDMRNYVNEIYTRTYNIEQILGTKIGALPQVPTSGQQATQQAYFEAIQNELRQIRSTQQQNKQFTSGSGSAVQCADVDCIKSTFFLIIIFLQSTAVLVFIFIRSKPGKAKFY